MLGQVVPSVGATATAPPNPQPTNPIVVPIGPELAQSNQARAGFGVALDLAGIVPQPRARRRLFGYLRNPQAIPNRPDLHTQTQEAEWDLGTSGWPLLPGRAAGLVWDGEPGYGAPTL